MAIVYFSHFWYYSDVYILVPLNHCKIFSCLIVVLRTAILKDPNMMMDPQTSIWVNTNYSGTVDCSMCSFSFTIKIQ